MQRIMLELMEVQVRVPKLYLNPKAVVSISFPLSLYIPYILW